MGQAHSVLGADGTGSAGTAGDPPPPERRPRVRAVVVPLLVVLTVATLGVLAVRWSAGTGDAGLNAAQVNRAVATAIAKAQEAQDRRPPEAATAYQAILPSLVSISAKVGKDTATGSGTVVNADGSILTALHVVAGSKDVRVRFADGTTSPAVVASKEPDDDIAHLRVARLPSVVVPAVLGGGVQVGDPVYPVGNPLGLTASLSGGLVSGLNRQIESEDGTVLKGLIQFDAAVNPGNSGGPLLNRAGQVVGVVTGLANPSHQSYFVGIGFAVPIETAGGGPGGPMK
ncbi:S1C family serine protease [Spongisporangium articulatum]|uniref:S1C family serine protease n=1 Tax=Spongisporangium articulatum TaxID=3362603 RepID=A0ABW8ANW6_9ACTN